MITQTHFVVRCKDSVAFVRTRPVIVTYYRFRSFDPMKICAILGHLFESPYICSLCGELRNIGDGSGIQWAPLFGTRIESSQ